MLYLDHCGSTPLSSPVKNAILQFIESNNFGNPAASHHLIGRKAQESIESARLVIANCLKAKPQEIIFTSGATEANNLLLWGFVNRYHARGCHIIFGATEHKSIYDTANFLKENAGITASEAVVDSNGIVDLTKLEDDLRHNKGKPTLVALMHINNEIPARHPVEEISKLCAKYGAFFHCDGVQGFVREPLNFNQGLFGSYVISTHKIYGPKGLGILVLGNGPLAPRLLPSYHGGDHEHGLRPGTLNTLAIIAGATAIKSHEELRTSRVEHLKNCSDIFIKILSEQIHSFRLTTPPNHLAAGIVNFYFDNQDSQSLLLKLEDICLNRGASCLGGGGERFSHVPRALGLPIEVQANVLRASFGDAITVEEVKIAVDKIIAALSK